MTTALARMNIQLNDIFNPQYTYAIDKLTHLVHIVFRPYVMEAQMLERLCQTLADNMYEQKLLTKAERGESEAYNLTFNTVRQLVTTILREFLGASIAKNSDDNEDIEQNGMIVSIIDELCEIRVPVYRKAPAVRIVSAPPCICCDGRSCGYVRTQA
jgi:hypothetical protein